MPTTVQTWPKPVDEDDYQFTLGAKFKKIAFEDLREDDNIRKQALAQLRECIVKHPSIRKCRMDSVFLLRFLRTKKFNVQASLDNLEKYLIIRQTFPDWFQKLDVNEPEVDELISAGYLVPLPRRDENGRQILLRCARKFDTSRFSPSSLIKTHALIAELLLDDEESQVAGFIYINDESEIPLSHISTFSLTDLRNLIRCLQNSTPMRHKETHLLNLPKFANQLIDFMMMLLSDKLKNRIMFHSSLDDLGRKIDLKLMPKEYGGEVPLSEIISDLKGRLQKRRQVILGLDDSYIEINKNTKNSFHDTDNGLVGSFRKLEVD